MPLDLTGYNGFLRSKRNIPPTPQDYKKKVSMAFDTGERVGFTWFYDKWRAKRCLGGGRRVVACLQSERKL